jgi:hypothetical protein
MLDQTKETKTPDPKPLTKEYLQKQLADIGEKKKQINAAMTSLSQQHQKLQQAFAAVTGSEQFCLKMLNDLEPAQAPAKADKARRRR